MNYETLELERTAAVCTIWLNRPKVRNAFDETMIAELDRAFRDVSQDDAIEIVVLAARGPAFCAGADLNWMKKMAGYSREENRADSEKLARMLHALYVCAKPTIARVHGDCYAGGMGLVAACDIAIAAVEMHFCISEVRIGLIPAVISPYLLRAMGERALARYMLTAERLSGAEAHRIGFVQGATSATDLDRDVSELVAQLKLMSPQGVREAKRLKRDIAGRPLDEALILETADRIADIRASEEGREGIQAFLNKRKPRWLASEDAMDSR